MKPTHPGTRILLVDDSDDDIFLVREAFKESGVEHHLDAISDGEAALNFLRDNAEDRPDVVLLDINMPRFSGFDVLEWVQSDPELRDIPIVMLTTSEQPEDVRRATEGGARDYFRKPVEFNSLRDLASRVLDRWGRGRNAPEQLPAAEPI